MSSRNGEVKCRCSQDATEVVCGKSPTRMVGSIEADGCQNVRYKNVRSFGQRCAKSSLENGDVSWIAEEGLKLMCGDERKGD